MKKDIKAGIKELFRLKDKVKKCNDYYLLERYLDKAYLIAAKNNLLKLYKTIF